MDKYNTGDILLFSYRGWKSPLDIISHIIEWFSPYLTLIVEFFLNLQHF